MTAKLAFLLATSLSLASFGEDVVEAVGSPIIAIQTSNRWLGINNAALLLDVRTNDGGVITSALEMKPDAALLEKVRALVVLAENEKWIADNRAKTEKPSATSSEKSFSRVKLTSKAGGRDWEYNFFIPDDLPVPVQQALRLVEDAAKQAKSVLHAYGLIICDDLGRPFAPDGLTYAEMYRRNSIPFMPAEADDLPAAYKTLKNSARHCGTLEKVDRQQWDELARVNTRYQGATLFTVEGRDVGCVLFPLHSMPNKIEYPLPREQRRGIVEQPDVSEPDLPPPD